MRIQEAIAEVKKSITRYEAMIAEGRGKNILLKLAKCQGWLNQLEEMRAGGKSPWHDYSELQAMYGLEDFRAKIINR